MSFLEKTLDVLPEWVKSKLVLRIIYTVGSFITARLISFLTGNYVNHALSVAITALAKVGINAVIQIVSINEKLLEASITGALMIIGEFVINNVHENHVKPIVVAQQEQTQVQGDKK